MPLHYCSSCAAKITYEAVKPASCPKCGKPIKDASAMLAQVASTVPASIRVPCAPAINPPNPPIIDAYHDNGAPLDDPPFRQPARSERSTPVVRKERRTARTTAKLYAGEEEGDRALGGDGEYYDRNEARRLAREWAAAFEGDGISLGDLKVHETTTFGALWKAGEAEREKGAAS